MKQNKKYYGSEWRRQKVPVSLWIWTDPGHCLHRGAGHLPLADRGLSGQVPPVFQIHSGLIMIR